MNFLKAKSRVKKAKEGFVKHLFKIFISAFMVALAGGLVNFTNKIDFNHKDIKASADSNNLEAKEAITHTLIQHDKFRDEERHRWDSLFRTLKHKR